MEFTTVKLRSGESIPLLGLGTFSAEPGPVGEAVKTAVKLGYRHIDCAQLYANEAEIGEALKELFESGVVKREELWITSKVWIDDLDDIEAAAHLTLKNLQLEYLDLYLIHWPLKSRKSKTPLQNIELLPFDIKSTWQAMENLKLSGKTRTIGVSNYTAKKLEQLSAFAKILPTVNQVECHPLWRQDKLRKYMEAHNIHLSAYAPLGSGLLGNKPLLDPAVEDLAKKHGKTPAQIVLRWGIQIGNSVLPKSTNPERLKSNVDLFDWSLSTDEMGILNNLPEKRMHSGDFFVSSKGSEYATVEDLWDGEGA